MNFIPLNNTTYWDWIDTIIDESSDKLTDWERSFLDSIGNWIASGKTLSEKQHEVLEKLYTKYTS